MGTSDEHLEEFTYPLRTAARLTGLSPELLRAWEKRHGVVEPIRTPGGTRRYRARDLERLRLVKAAVDAGHRIGRVAHLDTAELRKRTEPPAQRWDQVELGPILEALDSLDGAEAHRQLSIRLSALGPVRFARDCACPLAREVGERWVAGTMGIASEHLATSVLRSMLGAALQPTVASLLGPRVVFGTPVGERHELGLLMAALTAMGAGANPLYLGAELPVDDLLAATERVGASVLALGIVTVAPTEAERTLRALRAGLPDAVALWIGGSGASRIEPLDGVESMGDLEALEHRVALLSATENGR